MSTKRIEAQYFCATVPSKVSGKQTWLASLLAAVIVVQAPIPLAHSQNQGGGFSVVISQGATSTGFKDDGKCSVTATDIGAWIRGTSVFKDLNKAFDDAIAAWDGIAATQFHHKGGATGEYWRNQGKKKIQLKKDELKSLARAYIGRLKKSCDVCYLARDWATILKFATTIIRSQATSNDPTINRYKPIKDQAGNITGYEIDTSKPAIRIGNLTVGQVSLLDEKGVEKGKENNQNESLTATHAAKFYLAMNKLPKNGNGRPLALNVCLANLGLPGNDEKKYTQATSTDECTPEVIEQALYFWANAVYDRLSNTKSAEPKDTLKSKLKGSSLTICKPKSEFGDNLWALGRFIQ